MLSASEGLVFFGPFNSQSDLLSVGCAQQTNEGQEVLHDTVYPEGSQHLLDALPDSLSFDPDMLSYHSSRDF